MPPFQSRPRNLCAGQYARSMFSINFLSFPDQINNNHYCLSYRTSFVSEHLKRAYPRLSQTRTRHKITQNRNLNEMEWDIVLLWTRRGYVQCSGEGSGADMYLASFLLIDDWDWDGDADFHIHDNCIVCPSILIYRFLFSMFVLSVYFTDIFKIM